MIWEMVMDSKYCFSVDQVPRTIGIGNIHLQTGLAQATISQVTQQGNPLQPQLAPVDNLPANKLDSIPEDNPTADMLPL